MAGEIFIARQDTLEDVQGTVNTIDTNVDAVNTTTTAIKSETESIKTDTEALKLSTETIDQIADTILERIGLTNDSGGGTSEGSVFAKLNALLTQIASGGSSGWSNFKITDKSISGKNRSFSYTTTHPAIIMSETRSLDSNSYPVSFNKTAASFKATITDGGLKNVISFVSKGTTISGSTGSSSNNNYCHCIIAEFI